MGTALLPAVLATRATPVADLLAATLPEMILTAGLVLVLLLDAFLGVRRRLAPRVALGTVLLALAAVCLAFLDRQRPAAVQAGPLYIDDVARLFRVLFLATGAVTLLFAMRSEEEWVDQGEFHVLLLGSLAGMSVLAASVDLLTAYLAFETVSYTGYLMVGYRKGIAKASEAGVKYVIFGAVASGAMLFGLTYLFGWAGSTEMSRVAEAIRLHGAPPAVLLAAVLAFGGFAFKVSAVPFHFWCPDVYQGAPAPVAGFLAVASKAAGFAVAIRVLGMFGSAVEPVAGGTWFAFLPTGPLVNWLLAAGAVATMIVGNTAALRQTELQRLLAWSSIAHAGYLLMALCVGDAAAVGGVLFYFWVYLLMTLGAFGIVGILAPRLGGTDLSCYRGLGWRAPAMAAVLAVIMLSLAGLPPTAGFWGKVLLFKATIGARLYGLALVGLLTSAVSIFYYAKLLRVMYLEQPEEGAAPVVLDLPDWSLAALSTVPLLAGGLFGWWVGATGLLQTADEFLKACRT